MFPSTYAASQCVHSFKLHVLFGTLSTNRKHQLVAAFFYRDALDEFMTRSFKPSEHFKGMTLSLSSHPFNKISDGYSRNPYSVYVE